MPIPHLIELASTGSDNIGHLVVAERGNLPFAVRRTYWTHGVPLNKIRGHHAHHALEQLIVCVHNSLEITVETPDRTRHHFILDRPSQALYIPPMCWREIKFDPDAVLLCLASLEYDEADYIRSYYDYVQLVDGATQG